MTLRVPRKALPTIAGLAVLSALAGCAQGAAPLMSAAEAQQGLGAYRLGPGDKLRVTVYNEPNLSGEFMLSSSGALAFPLIGVVEANGLTVPQLSDALTRKIGADYMADPKLTVEVLNYRPFYILGEVKNPGEYPFAAGMTVEQAVAAAGGFSYRANTRVINLRRAAAAEERSVDLREGAPTAILPGDTIRVLERYF